MPGRTVQNRSIIFALLLAGCGGGSSNTTPHTDAPQTTITGVVFASDPFTGGTVNAYDFTGGVRGGLIASAVINAPPIQGTYRLTVPASSGAILIEAGSGCYTEKGIPWNFGYNRAPLVSDAIWASMCTSLPSLSAAVVVPSGATALVAAVTPYTHAAVGLAEYETRNGTTTTIALADANSRFSQWVGADILTTLPSAPTRTSTLSDATRYGLLLSGIPSWLLNVATTWPAVFGSGTLTTLAFAEAMKSDLAQDGILNGTGRDANGFPVALSVGNSAMTTTIYRHQIALYTVIRMRGETNPGGLNQTNADDATLVSFLPPLVAYNDAVNSLLDASAVVALDEGGPVVTIGYPSPGVTLGGTSGMDGLVHDSVGISISNTVMLIDGVQYTPFGDQYMPNHFISTTIFANGSHTLTIKATNNLGHVSTASVTVNFLN
jgi:hypothetical protein